MVVSNFCRQIDPVHLAPLAHVGPVEAVAVVRHL